MPEIKVDQNLMQSIANATNLEEIRNAMHAAGEAQGVISHTREGEVVVNPAQPEPQKFAATETIGGKKITFEADSEDELNQKITEAYRAQQQQKTDQQQTATRLDAEMRFKRGEISAAEFVEQYGDSPAGSSDLSKQWEKCVEEFLNSDTGADYPGGQESLQVMTGKLIAMGLEGNPSVESLVAAYEDAKAKGEIVAAGQPQVQVPTDASPEEIIELYKRQQGGSMGEANAAFMQNFSRGSSGLFGR